MKRHKKKIKKLSTYFVESLLQNNLTNFSLLISFRQLCWSLIPPQVDFFYKQFSFLLNWWKERGGICYCSIRNIVFGGGTAHLDRMLAPPPWFCCNTIYNCAVFLWVCLLLLITLHTMTSSFLFSFSFVFIKYICFCFLYA